VAPASSTRYPAVKAVVGVSAPTIIWDGDAGHSSLSWHGDPLTSVDPLFAERFSDVSRQLLASGADATDELAAAVDKMDADPATAAAIIPVERARASIFLITGSVDSQIPSTLYAELAMDRLTSHHYGFPFRHELYSGAGHLIDVPFIERSTEIGEGGGEAEANELAGEAMWPLVLKAFETMTP
jgi:bile acid acyltransferase/acyl-CoA thioester hydrolase-like protein